MAELRGHLAAWRRDESRLSAAELAELRFWMPSVAAERATLFRFVAVPLKSVTESVLSSTQRADIIDGTLKDLRKALDYRVKNEVSRIFDCGFFPDAFGRQLGLDLSMAGNLADDGLPLVIANLATADTDALYNSWRLGDRGPDRSNLCVLWYVRLMEYVNHVVLPERSKECGREMMHLHLVLLASYGSASARLMQLCCPVSLRFFQGMMQVGELLYPEIAATIWVWKPPWIASRIYQILSPMMEAHARAVTCFLSTEEGEKDLQRRLDSGPTCLGGPVSDSCMERDFELRRASIDVEESEELDLGRARVINL